MRAEAVIASHGNTDFDAFAAMLAARRLYPGAVVALAGLNRNVRDFYRLHADELDGVVEIGVLELDAIRRLILVEAATASRLGELEQLAYDPNVEKTLFDHHGDAELPDWLDPDAAVLSADGALTTTLVGILAEREIQPTPLEATAFALGIHEDTGSLTYSTSTQRDADALAWCLRHGARQDLLAGYLRTPLGQAERDLLQRLLESLEAPDAAGDGVLLAAIQWPEHVEGISNLAHKIVELTDATALVLLVEMEGRVFAVVRSRTDAIDARRIAVVLGGGGHAQAASAITRGELAEVRALVVEQLELARPQQPRARDVMSRPPRSVEPDADVAAAMALCQRHGQSGVFVVDGGRLVGSVSRESLDKAIGHGLAHAPVRGIMSGKAITAPEDATIGELRALVTSADDGRVAVLRDEELVGVVARADLLRVLEGAEPAQHEPRDDLAHELRHLEHLHPLFEAVAALGERAGGVYLVGGTVRDILLGEQSFDVDIAVEGDAIEVARGLAERLGGRVTPHEKFGTAVVQYGEGARLDVVTTRTEFYDAPGALPAVERASLREDLFRRDFTVNAMAASLAPADFGRLLDPFGGRSDLDARLLRVLHNLSFVDDPTRIFRAIRYEARYGLRLEEHSARLARACIELGLVGELSSARLRDELQALLDDPGAPGGIVRLGELGADRAIHAHLRGDAEAAARFSQCAPASGRARRRAPRLAHRPRGARSRDDLGGGVRLARATEGSPPRRRADRRCGRRRAADRRAAARRGAGAGGAGRARRSSSHPTHHSSH